jgi:hypothetical protein
VFRCLDPGQSLSHFPNERYSASLTPFSLDDRRTVIVETFVHLAHG